MMTDIAKIPDKPGLKSQRSAAPELAERSVRREPTVANSQERVVLAAWTAAAPASAAFAGGNPAGAGCPPFASAARCGWPDCLNVSHAGTRGGISDAICLQALSQACLPPCVTSWMRRKWLRWCQLQSISDASLGCPYEASLAPTLVCAGDANRMAKLATRQKGFGS